MLMDRESQHSNNIIYPQLIYTFSVISVKIPERFFVDTDNTILKFVQIKNFKTFKKEIK